MSWYCQPLWQRMIACCRETSGLKLQADGVFARAADRRGVADGHLEGFGGAGWID